MLAFACAACLGTTGYAESIAPPAELVDGFEVRVATVNMWGIPYVSTYMDERFAALGERLNASDLDLVGLQEVWADGPRLALRDAVRARFPYQADFQSDTGGSGLLILSRWPIAKRDFRQFPINGKPWKPWHGDWWGKKGVGIVRVDSPGGPIWFATTHLHARYAPRPPNGDGMDDEYAYDRWHQVHEVRGLVAQHAGAASAIIVGDFNFRPGSHYYTALTGDRVMSARDPAWVDGGLPTPDRKRIDFIWVRPGVRRTWQVPRPARQILADRVPLANGEDVRLTDHPAVGAVLTASPSPTGGLQLDVAVRTAARSTWTPGALPQAPLSAALTGAHAWEFVCMFGLGCLFIGIAGAVVPWRTRAKRSLFDIPRGIIAAALLFVGFWVMQVTLNVARGHVAAEEFWEATRPELVAEAAEGPY